MFYIGLDVRDGIIGLDNATSACPVKEYNSDLDDIRSLLFDICQVLARTESVLFVVEGFDEKPWPVDVSTDLVTFLEQVPDLLDWFDSEDSSKFVLDFYEQGIERSLIFDRTDSVINIACESRTDWEPKYDEVVQKADFDVMFTEFLRNFIHCTKILCPGILNHAWFYEWRGKESILKRISLG
jgi:hypothetical protein